MKLEHVTIAYEVTNEAEFAAAGNPLKFTHPGLRAHTVSAYDAIARLRAAEQAPQPAGATWCEHIFQERGNWMIADPFMVSMSVPMNWICCPICRAERPGTHPCSSVSIRG